MRNLHRTAHIRVVIVVTSGIYAEGPADLQYASEWHPSAPGTWNDADYSLLRFDTPVILGAFVGTWVVYSSLLVVGYTHFNGNLERAICAVISPVQGHLRRTSYAAYGDALTNAAHVPFCASPLPRFEAPSSVPGTSS